ncbi:hypothetical protein BD324DRAFT_348797 [Kockovaella imperatae]|uniref:Uncharacterized protein n=1 Tax=Kockovaella imperatae TaxID=4999 RepID=A0A1Y1UMF5_9TREE|nr:hypothetical protein BD324DRAFT_348797 [Kockovaella imperatae]ORX38315.1 hypothetical protein BD324DRAFT_348797 [Kockovaella imperatae]
MRSFLHSSPLSCLLSDITEAIERHRRDTDALLAADREDERRRLILSPPARSAPPAHQPNQPRIRLGGAVLRRGDQQINYAAQAGQRGNPTITAGLRHPPDDPRDPARRVMPAPARRWDDGEFDRYQRTRDLEEYLFDDDEEGDPLDEYVPPEGNPNYRDPLVPRPGPLGAGLAHRAGAQGLLERLLGILPGTHRRDPTLGLAPDIAAILGRAGPAFRGGAAAGEEGVAEVLERVAPFHYPPAKMDFTTNFEFDLADKQPISVDDNGNVVDKPKTKSKPFLSCVRCHDPLLNSSHYRSDDDRIWALRCGHLIDQKCLVKISVPESDTASGTDKDEPPVKRPARRRKAAPKKNVQPPPEYTYACPVEGCTGKCVSISGDDGWEQKHGHGALVAFV